MDLFLFLKEFAHKYKLDDSKEVLIKIMNKRLEIHSKAMKVYNDDVLLTLKILKNKNFKIGLVSNCTSEVPQMLSKYSLDTYFNSMVFSFSEGIAKPNPIIFNKIATNLNVKPEKILYIGDGFDEELAGASYAGMTPVLLKTNNEISWNGYQINHLSDILYYLI